MLLVCLPACHMLMPPELREIELLTVTVKLDSRRNLPSAPWPDVLFCHFRPFTAPSQSVEIDAECHVAYILAYKPTIFGWILALNLQGSACTQAMPHSQSQLNIQHYSCLFVTPLSLHVLWTIRRSLGLCECVGKWVSASCSLSYSWSGGGLDHTQSAAAVVCQSSQSL